MRKQQRRFVAHSKLKKRKQKRQLQLAIYAVVLVLVVFAVVYGLTYRYVNKTDKAIIHKNVFIGQADVSGMNAEEAVQALETEVAKYGAIGVVFHVGDASAEATLQDLGLSMSNLKEAVDEAVAYGKNGSVWKRLGQIRKLKKEAKVFEDVYAVDEEITTSYIEEYVQVLEVKAQDAKIERAGNSFMITEEKAGTAVDTEASIKDLHTYLNQEWNYETFEFEMKLIVDEPQIKSTDLETIQDELGSFYTDAGSGDRVKNLIRASELLHGTVLMPGEELSVEAKTVPYTEENGYVSGSAYENGQIVQSIGGGLCQVSTTLYNAALYAELEIVTRYAHSMTVNYVSASRDAAIAEGIKDLKIKNPYDTPILIEGYIDGANNLRFYIYGKETRPEGRTVEFVSEITEKIPYTKKFVASTSMSLGEKKSEGSKMNGAVAKLWKVVYEEGKEVSRDVINNSKYRASELTVTIGVSSDCAEATTILKNAIASQDEDKINAAISEAKKVAEDAKAAKTESTETEE